jgi:hypothetical protein
MSTTSAWLLMLQLGSTAAMAGLIWCIQLAHYPLFSFVDRPRFPEFETAHRWRISVIVGPLMALELLTALLLVISPPEATNRNSFIALLALLLLVHASTLFLQVPMHEKLNVQFDDANHRRLVRTNWIRTVLWTVRAVGITAVIVGAIS